MAELTYRQKLALFCLATNGEPCTSADLMERMGEAAQAAGHPRTAWIDFSAAKIARDLQLLLQRNLVVQSDRPRMNTRRGREEPTWQVVKVADEFQLPSPVEGTPPTTGGHVVQVQTRPVAGESQRARYEGMPVEQLITLLEVHDDFTGLISRFMRDVGELQRDAKRRLLAAGFEIPSK